jgi:hypothetical protein
MAEIAVERRMQVACWTELLHYQGVRLRSVDEGIHRWERDNDHGASRASLVS